MTLSFYEMYVKFRAVFSTYDSVNVTHYLNRTGFLLKCYT